MARKQRVGFAVADARHKTVSVRVERTVQHPLYKKIMRRRKRYLAHDEGNDCKNGDRVVIEECRPLSKRKSWRVVEILERRVDDAPQSIDSQADAETVTSAASPESEAAS